ncbi:oxidoreductase [Umezawaea sp. NPDC059074]|uniref:oxidoreductase n=1 Tax=Umezawaea sp. NPDC059074 TaxID=3346716 RepID=UPI00367510B9
MTAKVALVTGGSSGIGESTATALRTAGWTVYAAARRTEKMASLAAAGIHVMAMDVTDDESMATGIADIVRREGRIDALVNNAGYGSYGALEDVPLSEGRAQIEVNLFGLARLTQLVLPHMRAQRNGTIVNISSMGGRFATPLGSWYHASKFAVEGLSDALRLEVEPRGIKVVLVEPGSIRTEWGAVAASKLLQTSGSGAYAPQAAAVATSLESSSQPDSRLTSEPSVIAKAVVRALTARRPKARYQVGFGARPLIFLSRVLPTRTFDSLSRSLTRMPAA